MIVFLVCIIIILVVVLIAVILHYKKSISGLSKSLDNTLDDMLAEKIVDFDIDKETMESKLHAKLKRLYEILNDKTKQSKADREQIQSLISDISHQVKTPVANLKMYGQILSERKLSDIERDEFLSLLNNQINKLDFLMQALVKISRLEKGIISFSPEKTFIHQIIAECLADVMLKAEEKNIDINISCLENIYAICDMKWTKEAVFNILDNAVKYTHQDGLITIFAEVREYYTVISIKDNGIGISEAERTRWIYLC